MTNYEKIKSMSVDELAGFLESTTSIVAIKLNGEYVCNNKDYIKQWLESESD